MFSYFPNGKGAMLACVCEYGSHWRRTWNINIPRISFKLEASVRVCGLSSNEELSSDKVKAWCATYMY